VEKTFLFSFIVALVSALVGWIFGKHKSSGPGNNVGSGDSAGIAGDLQQAADEAGAVTDGLAEGAADSGELAEDLGEAADLLGDAIERLEEQPGDPDRADDLLSELLTRYGE
jgi:hypothetical protein